MRRPPPDPLVGGLCIFGGVAAAADSYLRSVRSRKRVALRADLTETLFDYPINNLYFENCEL